MLSITAEEQAVRFGPAGGVYRIVTTAAETGGRHFAFEVTEPPGGGPPLHTHAAEDEYFAVLDGEITFYIDGQIRTVGAGGSAFVTRGVPHTFRNLSGRHARVLVLFTPGAVEGFFDYGLPIDGARPGDDLLVERIAALAPAFGVTVLGPSPL
jgi:quercetin dioxygenase-like cupin family protein